MKKIKKVLIAVVLIIPIFLAGTATGLYYASSKITNEARWAMNYPRHAKWAMERHELIKRASETLYFEDTNEGMTIIKPFTKEVK